MTSAAQRKKDLEVLSGSRKFQDWPQGIFPKLGRCYMEVYETGGTSKPSIFWGFSIIKLCIWGPSIYGNPYGVIIFLLTLRINEGIYVARVPGAREKERGMDDEGARHGMRLLAGLDVSTCFEGLDASLPRLFSHAKSGWCSKRRLQIFF